MNAIVPVDDYAFTRAQHAMPDITITTTDRQVRKKLGRRAFTLVELSIVMLIIAILTVVTVPTLGDSLDFHRVEAAAERISFDLQLAQNRARMASTAQAIDFSTATSSYILPGVPDLDHLSEDYRVDLSRPPYDVLLTYVSFSNSDLQFNGFGVPDQAGEVDVEAGSYSRTVIISSTGKVTIE